MPERLCRHRFVTTDPPSILKLNPIYFLRSRLGLLSPSLQQPSLTASVASTLVFHRFEASFVVKWASFPSEYLARLQDYRNTYPVSKTATLETRMSLSLTRKPPFFFFLSRFLCASGSGAPCSTSGNVYMRIRVCMYV